MGVVSETIKLDMQSGLYILPSACLSLNRGRSSPGEDPFSRHSGPREAGPAED